MASDEPSASTMMSRSLWRSSPAFVSAENMTPLEMITRNEERSQRPGSASRARRIGLAKASPTIDIEFTRLRSIVSSNSTASKRRFEQSPEKVTNAAVPCMSGAAGRFRGPALVARAAAAAGSGTSGRRLLLALSRASRRSSCRHITPLGIPVVPPV